MAVSAGAKAAAPRLDWLDGAKGISILWIVVFHFYGSWMNQRYPSSLSDGYFGKFFAACEPAGALGVVLCSIEAVAVMILQLGFHPVGVFLLLSGFGLSFSLAKTGAPERGWLDWYGKRLVRLFPLYWTAHLVYLVTPFAARPEAIDWRFALSFLGDRIWPIDMIFYYANPAWWYFGVLIQLYLVFPILWKLHERLGGAAFVALSLIATFAARHVLLSVFPVNGLWVQGGFFACRLAEFACGMALGALYRRRGAVANAWLFHPAALAIGFSGYVAGLYTYGSLAGYVVTDALTGIGLFVIVAHVARAAAKLGAFGWLLTASGMYSYGLFLLHQPYVIYFGERLRDLSLWPFLIVAAATVAILAFLSAQLERAVNALTDRALARPRPLAGAPSAANPA